MFSFSILTKENQKGTFQFLLKNHGLTLLKKSNMAPPQGFINSLYGLFSGLKHYWHLHWHLLLCSYKR